MGGGGESGPHRWSPGRCRVELLLWGEPSGTTSGPSAAGGADAARGDEGGGEGGGGESLFCAVDDALDAPGLLGRALRRLCEGLDAHAAHGLLEALRSELGALLLELKEGAHFQFAAASVWLVYDAGGGPGAEAPAVRLSHFAGLAMTRTASCDAAFLAGIHALHDALGPAQADALAAPMDTA